MMKIHPLPPLHLTLGLVVLLPTLVPQYAITQTPVLSESRLGLERRAALGDQAGMLLLAESLVSPGMTRDYDRAALLFKRLADGGVPDAKGWLGFLMVQGKGTQINVPAGISLINDSADSGSGVGLRFKGWLLNSGLNGPADPRGALVFWSMAGERGDGPALDAAGLAYYSGRGTRLDRSRAASFFQRGSLVKDPDCALHLGQMFESGNLFADPLNPTSRVSTPDYERARDLYHIAADGGNRIASYRLGRLLLRSTNASDTQAAIRYLRRSASQSYAPAMMSLGSLYEGGTKVPGNQISAYVYYLQARAAGSADATPAILRMNGVIGDVERTTAVNAFKRIHDSRSQHQ